MAPLILTILVDTREQRPLDFTSYRDVRTERATLGEGDYTARGIERLAIVERKGLLDLVGCVAQERERFERELERMANYQHRTLVVEASLADITSAKWWMRSQVTANAVLGSLAAWHTRFGIAPVFAGNPAGAAAFVYRWLRRVVLDEQEQQLQHGAGLPTAAEWRELEREAAAIDERRAGRAGGAP